MIFTFQKKKISSSSLIYIYLFIYILFLNYILAKESDFFRIQYLPVGMTAMLLIAFLSISTFRTKTKIFLITIIVLSTIVINFHYLDQTFKLGDRLVSFKERLSIFTLMFRASFDFLIPQGLGSSLRNYDISVFDIGYTEAGRRLYPPHSGLASVLYENSIYVFTYIAFKILSIVKSEIKQKLVGAKMPSLVEHNGKILKSNILYKKRDKYFLIMLLVIFTWFIHNLLYLKGIVTPDYFTDDGVIIYSLIFILSYESYLTKTIIDKIHYRRNPGNNI